MSLFLTCNIFLPIGFYTQDFTHTFEKGFCTYFLYFRLKYLSNFAFLLEWCHAIFLTMLVFNSSLLYKSI